MHVQALHTTFSLRQTSRRQHLAPWRWCGGSPCEECDADSQAVRVILSTTIGINHTNMHVQALHTLSVRQSSRRQHLALCRGLWRGGSPGEECDADSQAVRVILSTTTGINHTRMHAQDLHTTLSLRQNSRRQHLALLRWCGGSPGEECDADSQAVRIILFTTTGSTIRACTGSAHDTEPGPEQSKTAPGPLTGSLAQRQPWRGVRR
jgi:hypothetical protein